MPTAHAGETKYAYRDHETDQVWEVPPIQNQWYTVFDAEDVRLLWCFIWQTNDEVAEKIVEVKWTIDGNVYVRSKLIADTTDIYVYRAHASGALGTDGLEITAAIANAGFYVDKRGHSFKVEVMMVDPPGTNQQLLCDCVRETLEQT